MKIYRTEYYHDLDFDKYLKLPGVSFSSLKPPVKPTEAMNLGTRVHNYLLEPKKYDYINHEIVAPIAAAIRKIVDPGKFDCEVSVTSNFEHVDFVLPYKGRIDLLCPKRLVIDLKVLNGPLDNAIQYFRYDRQISGYCMATGAERGVIIAYNKRTKNVEMKAITPNEDFWKQVVITKGEVRI